MSSDVMSVQDNRVADEDDTLAFLNEAATQTHTVTLRRDASSLLLECHLTNIAVSG